MSGKAFSYLGKTEIDKSFKKLQKENDLSLEYNYDNCCETIKQLKEYLISEIGEYFKFLDGNLVDLTEKYRNEYPEYVREIEKENRSRYCYSPSNPVPVEEYIQNQFKSNDSSEMRFEKYIPTKIEENKVLYFELNQPYYHRSNFSFCFCLFYNSDNMLCIDKINLKKIRYKRNIEGIDSAKSSPERIKEFFKNFVLLDKKGKEAYEKNQLKLKDDKIKREKVNKLKLKAGEINIKQILDEIDCDYTVEEQGHTMLVSIKQGKGKTRIKIPKKNVAKSLEFLKGYVETIIEADKLKIHFKHFQH